MRYLAFIAFICLLAAIGMIDFSTPIDARAADKPSSLDPGARQGKAQQERRAERGPQLMAEHPLDKFFDSPSAGSALDKYFVDAPVEGKSPQTRP